MSNVASPSKRDRSVGGSGNPGGATTAPFFGRRAELDALREAIADDTTRAVLVVGHEGMGKSAILERLMDKIHHDSKPWGVIFYQTFASDSVDTILERIIEDAYAAANTEAGSFGGTEQRKRQWAALWKAVKAIPVVKNAAEMTEAIHDLAFSLKRDVTRGTRDQFIERLNDVSKRMPPDGRAVFVIDPDPEMPAKSDQLWASVLRELPSKIKFVFAQRPNDALVSAESRFHELERQRHVVRVPANGLQGLDDEGWDDFLKQSALRLGLTRNILEDALAHYDRHPYCVTAAVGLIEQGDSPSDLPPDPVGIAKRQWQVATGRPNGEQAADLLQAYAILEVPVPDEVVRAVSGLKTNNALTRWRNDPFVGTLITEFSETASHHQVYHRILSNFIRSITGDDDCDKLHRRAMDIYRACLDAMPPDGLAARRLALHVRSVEGEDAFVTCFLDECTPKLAQLGLLDEIEALTAQAVPTVQARSGAMTALLGNRGIVLGMRGELDGAEAIFRKSLEIDKKLERRECMAKDYYNLGWVLFKRGDLEGAKAMCRESQKISQELGQLVDLFNNHFLIGNVLREQHDLDGAETMFRKGLGINEKLARPEGIAYDYGNLGNVLDRRGDLQEAEEMYGKALEIFEDLGHREGVATTYHNLAFVQLKKGYLHGARELWIKARDLFKQIGMQQMVEIVQSVLDKLPAGDEPEE